MPPRKRTWWPSSKNSCNNPCHKSVRPARRGVLRRRLHGVAHSGGGDQPRPAGAYRTGRRADAHARRRRTQCVPEPAFLSTSCRDFSRPTGSWMHSMLSKARVSHFSIALPCGRNRYGILQSFPFALLKARNNGHETLVECSWYCRRFPLEEGQGKTKTKSVRAARTGKDMGYSLLPAICLRNLQRVTTSFSQAALRPAVCPAGRGRGQTELEHELINGRHYRVIPDERSSRVPPLFRLPGSPSFSPAGRPGKTKTKIRFGQERLRPFPFCHAPVSPTKRSFGHEVFPSCPAACRFPLAGARANGTHWNGNKHLHPPQSREKAGRWSGRQAGLLSTLRDEERTGEIYRNPHPRK